MTLPTAYGWFPLGQRLLVPYEAPQGRRVNAIGAHFTHGPEAGRLLYQTWAALPKRHAKKQRKTLQEMAAAHGLSADQVGSMLGACLTSSGSSQDGLLRLLLRGSGSVRW